MALSYRPAPPPEALRDPSTLRSPAREQPERWVWRRTSIQSSTPATHTHQDRRCRDEIAILASRQPRSPESPRECLSRRASPLLCPCGETVRPSFTSRDFRDLLKLYPVVTSDGGQFLAVRAALPNLFHLIRRQLRRRIRLPWHSCAAPLQLLVLHIVCVRPEKQMIRTNAPSVVTAMQNREIPRRAVHLLPSNAVSTNRTIVRNPNDLTRLRLQHSIAVPV